jgi:hypothetical protein
MIYFDKNIFIFHYIKSKYGKKLLIPFLRKWYLILKM